MQILLTTTDPILTSWLLSRLREEGIEAEIFDRHTSILQGSIGAIPQRVMVRDEDLGRARLILQECGNYG